MTPFALLGATGLYLLFIWLASAAGAVWLAERKGYGERVGLFFGLILSAVGFAVVLLLPARPGSTWKREGPLPNPGARRPLGTSAAGPATTPAPPLPPATAPDEPPAADETHPGDAG
jgi:hypothetical protein